MYYTDVWKILVKNIMDSKKKIILYYTVEELYQLKSLTLSNNLIIIIYIQ